MVLNSFLWFLLATPACPCVQYIVPHTTTVILRFPSFGCRLQQQTHSQKWQNRFKCQTEKCCLPVVLPVTLGSQTNIPLDKQPFLGCLWLHPRNQTIDQKTGCLKHEWFHQCFSQPTLMSWSWQNLQNSPHFKTSCLNTHHRNQSEDFAPWYYTSTSLILHD